MAYVWARDAKRAGDNVQRVVARFFFPKYGAVIEDPGTGSACANLGGWLLATDASLPQRIAVAQGDEVGRPCRLGLEVSQADAGGRSARLAARDRWHVVLGRIWPRHRVPRLGSCRCGASPRRRSGASVLPSRIRRR